MGKIQINVLALEQSLRDAGIRQYRNQAARMQETHSVVISESSPGEDRNVRLQFIDKSGKIRQEGYNAKVASETIRAWMYMRETGDPVASAYARTECDRLRLDHPICAKRFAI